MSEYQAAAAAGKDMLDSTLKTTSNMSPDNATPPYVLEDTKPHGPLRALRNVLDNDLHQHHADLQVGTAVPQSRSCLAPMSLVVL